MKMDKTIQDYKYIFYLPSYQKNSNGIVSIWEAAYYFSKYRDTSILITDVQTNTNIPKKYDGIKTYFQDELKKLNKSNWFHLSDSSFDESSIHIHPDDPHGYLTNFEFDQDKIVKYIMCRSLMLSEHMLTMSKNDYGLSYSNAISTIFPSYLIINDNILNIIGKYKNIKKKNKVLIYYGKVRYGQSFKNLKRIVKEFDEYEIIHRLYPSDSKDLYEKIAESSLFISIDPLTSLLHESTLIGTPAYVYDSAYKEFYDNFDFKLHGFYYDLDPSDLDKVFHDSVNLSDKASETAYNFMATIDERTIETIKNIEKHFLEKSCSTEKITAAINEDVKFFNEKWKVPTIFNCISYRSIYRYHLINRYKFLAILVLYLNRIRIKFRNIFMLNYLTLEEKTIVKKYLGRKFISESTLERDRERIFKHWK